MESSPFFLLGLFSAFMLARQINATKMSLFDAEPTEEQARILDFFVQLRSLKSYFLRLLLISFILLLMSVVLFALESRTATFRDLLELAKSIAIFLMLGHCLGGFSVAVVSIVATRRLEFAIPGVVYIALSVGGLLLR